MMKKGVSKMKGGIPFPDCQTTCYHY